MAWEAAGLFKIERLYDNNGKLEMRILESDWKIFKELRLLALERFSQRVLDEC